MPTYGYRCPSCGNDFEVFQRMTDEALADCAKCGRPARRVFFPAGIVFKGSGFYKTDSRKSEANGSSSAPGKESTSSRESTANGSTGDSTSKDSQAKDSTSKAPASKPAPSEPSPSS